MTHYEILGVSVKATDLEIKQAYRRLVKMYHPDRNKSQEAAQRIAQINEAYDVLSDPQKRWAYDNRLYSQFELPEDPREAARREYRAKKAREAKVAAAKNIAREKLILKIAGWVSLPLVVVAFIIILDDWLPVRTYKETAKVGWQERRGDKRRSHGQLVSFMETQHFEFPVPTEIHLTYDYYDNPEVITIEASPIFKKVKRLSMIRDGAVTFWDDPYELYSSSIPWHYLLFLSAFFTAVRKEYTLVNYALCFLPFLLGSIIFVFYFL